MSAVPQIAWTPQGLVIPNASAVLAGVQADINAAFNNNLNFTNQSTPQAQLAASFAAVVSACYGAIAYFVNQINPNAAMGFMQDAIAQIYFLTRNAGIPTSVLCQCVGLVGTFIPAGATAQDTSGNLYTCTQSGTIPIGGTITLPFANAVVGPIPCPANTLTSIYQAIPGWDTINNSSAGTVGANTETQQEFELRRLASVAANGQGSLPSIYGAVFNVPNVIDVYVYENDTSSPVTVGATSYSVAANSIYVGVVGGDPAAIGQAIYTKKSPGCGMVGNNSVTVTDQSGYQIPYPEYTVSFNIPTGLPIFFAVSIKNTTGLPSNIAALVQAAIIAQFTGANGAPRARIGSLLLASDYFAAVFAASPGMGLLSIFVGTASSPSATNVLVGIDQTPTIVAADITVTLV